MDDLAILKNPSSWPGLVLPIKNYALRKAPGGPPLAACVTTNGFGQLLFIQTNIWAITGVTHFEILAAEAPVTTAEALVAEGWMVD